MKINRHKNTIRLKKCMTARVIRLKKCIQLIRHYDIGQTMNFCHGKNYSCLQTIISRKNNYKKIKLGKVVNYKKDVIKLK